MAHRSTWLMASALASSLACWTALPGSTALGADLKSYDFEQVHVLGASAARLVPWR